MIKLRNLGLAGILALFATRAPAQLQFKPGARVRRRGLGGVLAGALAAMLLAFGITAHAQTPGSFSQSTNSTEVMAGDDGEIGTTDDVAAVTSAHTLAAELFGGDAVDLRFDTDFVAPTYKLTYRQARDGAEPPLADVSGSIARGNEGLVTFMLSGATFGKRVTPNNFAAADDTGATFELMDGGAPGDNMVQVKVTAAAAWDDGDAIILTLPDLKVTGTARMSSSFMIEKTSNFPEGHVSNRNCDPAMMGDTAATVRGCPLIRTHKFITEFTLSGDTMPSIDLMSREKLIAGDKNIEFAQIGKVDLKHEMMGVVVGSEGGAIDDFDGELAGELVMMVTSDAFRAGDKVKTKVGEDYVFFDVDVDEGVAVGEVGLAGGSWKVYYRPNGEDDLEHGTEFKVSAMTDFSNRSNGNARAKAGSATSITSALMLNGISGEPAKAYAIAPLSSTDNANVRITCESAKGCNAFLNCSETQIDEESKLPAVMSHFGEMGIMIPANGTVRLDKEGVATQLGLMEGESWQGRLSCDVLSTGEISVQVLTRSGDALVNNTYVSSGGG